MSQPLGTLERKPGRVGRRRRGAGQQRQAWHRPPPPAPAHGSWSARGSCLQRTHTHSPADVERRGQSACVTRHPNLSTPKKRLPEELSLRPPHIATKDPPLFRSLPENTLYRKVPRSLAPTGSNRITVALLMGVLYVWLYSLLMLCQILHVTQL